jgi:hypothetical protein
MSAQMSDLNHSQEEEPKRFGLLLTSVPTSRGKS